MAYVSPTEVLANIANVEPAVIIDRLAAQGYTIIPTRDASLLNEMCRIMVALGNIQMSVNNSDWKELLSETLENDVWRARQTRSAAWCF